MFFKIYPCESVQKKYQQFLAEPRPAGAVMYALTPDQPSILYINHLMYFCLESFSTTLTFHPLSKQEAQSLHRRYIFSGDAYRESRKFTKEYADELFDTTAERAMEIFEWIYANPNLSDESVGLHRDMNPYSQKTKQRLYDKTSGFVFFKIVAQDGWYCITFPETKYAAHILDMIHSLPEKFRRYDS